MRLKFKRNLATALGVFTPNTVAFISDKKLAKAWVDAGLAEPVEAPENKAEKVSKEVKSDAADAKPKRNKKLSKG